mgnify:FL=1
MRDALMTERSGPACIILRRVKSGRLVKSPFRPSHKPPRFGVPEEIRTPDPTLRRRVLYPAELLGHVYLPNHLSGFLKKCQEAAPKVARFFPPGRIQWEA